MRKPTIMQGIIALHETMSILTWTVVFLIFLVIAIQEILVHSV